MTDDSRIGLIKQAVIESSSNAQDVLNAVKDLGTPLPKEIKQYLDNKILQEAQRDYESGKISREDIKKVVKEKSITIRTIHRKLATLTKKRLLNHNGNRYSLSGRVSQDIRYFADRFRYQIRSVAGRFPVGSMEQNIKEMVRNFGALIIYSFIVGATPIEDKSIDLREKARITTEWIENVIPLGQFYDLFHAVFMGEPGSKDFKDFNHSLTRTLDKTTIVELKKLFKKCYPDIYNHIEEMKLKFMLGTKTAYVGYKNASPGSNYIIRYEDEP
jgi:Ca2+-binding EF-hand superfamily protein